MKPNFIIQVNHDLDVMWDFQWELLLQLQDQDNPASKDFTYELSFSTSKWGIPVGSVEFVENVMRWQGLPVPGPLKVPEELSHFNGREVNLNATLSQLQSDLSYRGELFVKDGSKVKGFTGIINRMAELPDDVSVVDYSEVVDILSEWRAFVHRGKLIDIMNYSGDPMEFPNRSVVEQAVKEYTDSPIAYTMDFAVIDPGYSKMGDHWRKRRDTVIIELHRMYSCGTYGFNSPKYPYMLSQAWHEIKSKNILK